MVEPLNFEIDDHERRHLSELLRHPGYRVLKQIEQAYIDALRETAIAASSVDPLANRDGIAVQWAYVAIAEQIQRARDQGTGFEIGMIGRLTPITRSQQQAERRRAIILGELDQQDGDAE